MKYTKLVIPHIWHMLWNHTKKNVFSWVFIKKKITKKQNGKRYILVYDYDETPLTK